MTQGAAEIVHLLVAVALTYALGFERDLRGAPAGDRVFALIGAAAGLVGVFAVHGALVERVRVQIGDQRPDSISP